MEEVRDSTTRLAGFNRTFMELKWSCTHRETTGWCVLIVPLWN